MRKHPNQILYNFRTVNADFSMLHTTTLRPWVQNRNILRGFLSLLNFYFGIIKIAICIGNAWILASFPGRQLKFRKKL